MIARISAVVGAFRPEEPELSASEIARRVGLPKASIARIVRDLVDFDFLERTPGGYRVGIKCFELGQLAQKPKDLRRMALATMADLRQATGLTVQLGVLDGSDVVYIEILRGKHADLVIPSRVGGRVASYATAGGKALLAFSGDAVLERADEFELVDLTPEELIERFKEGKVYLPDQAKRALEHFFQQGSLIALRELSLRLLP